MFDCYLSLLVVGFVLFVVCCFIYVLYIVRRVFVSCGLHVMCCVSFCFVRCRSLCVVRRRSLFVVVCHVLLLFVVRCVLRVVCLLFVCCVVRCVCCSV